MTNVAESNGTVNFDQELTDTRQIWREAVQAVAERAKATLPESNGRIEKAVSLVIAGDVDMLGDGTARVASQSHGQTVYHIVNGHCDCRDYEHAPEAWCKHRLAHAIAKRAHPVARAKLEAGTNGHATVVRRPVPATSLPEAPASCNVYVTLAGRKVQVTLRDMDEERLLGRLEALLTRFPAEEAPQAEQAQPEGWCHKHGLQMRQQCKDGRSWWSHKTADGWCKGK